MKIKTLQESHDLLFDNLKDVIFCIRDFQLFPING